jgi:NitT/TauT family transport system permease protein
MMAFSLRRFTPLLSLVAALAIWQLTMLVTSNPIFPSPLQVVKGLVELVTGGVLHKYIVASLFRVMTGFLLAVVIGVPIGIWMGANTGAGRNLNPLIQVLRPISPIAWIPLAILWFGVSDLAPIFLIFISCVFPLMTASAAAVHNIPKTYFLVAKSFDVRGWEYYSKVIFPAILPQLLTSIRVSLGVGWLVVVAAEMIAVNSGLGYLIIDARNAGMRYDLVVAGMIVIGAVGLMMDYAVRRIERLDSLRWGFSE